MGVRDNGSYYIKEESKIKEAKRETPKKNTLKNKRTFLNLISSELGKQACLSERTKLHGVYRKCSNTYGNRGFSNLAKFVIHWPMKYVRQI